MLTQHAILFTKDNADVVAEPLLEYSPSELLADYQFMLKDHDTLVLCLDETGRGVSILSYVVTISMFERNNPGIELNDKTYTFVRNVN